MESGNSQTSPEEDRIRVDCIKLLTGQQSIIPQQGT